MGLYENLHLLYILVNQVVVTAHHLRLKNDKKENILVFNFWNYNLYLFIIHYVIVRNFKV